MLHQKGDGYSLIFGPSKGEVGIGLIYDLNYVEFLCSLLSGSVPQHSERDRNNWQKTAKQASDLNGHRAND